MVANRTRLIAASVIFWSLPGIAFGVSMVLSGNLWLSVAVLVLGVVAAGAILRRYVATLTNDHLVAATEHGVDGRIEAVEVFWRPGCPFSEGLGRSLDDAGVPMNLRNIWESPDDAAIVRSIADGDETVPTLIIGPVALVNPSAGWRYPGLTDGLGVGDHAASARSSLLVLGWAASKSAGLSPSL